ncbi:MAG: hypothetical protein N3C12_15155 [Candidatus Binatia bacterium]|nr:hypothetical protein [Candidatus Binatia bacterium]
MPLGVNRTLQLLASIALIVGSGWEAPILAQQPTAASGLIRARGIEVETSRLVTLLGSEATEPAQVFAVPIERLLTLAKQADSGVRVEESEFRLQNGRLRVDGMGSDKANYVLVDLASGTMEWVQPKHKAHIEWRKPPAPARSPTPLPQLEPLQKEATINGFRTRGYRLQTPAGTAWLWIADEPRALAPVLKSLAELQTQIKANPESFDQVAAVRGMHEGVLVRLQVLTPKQYIVRELVSFTPKTWSAADFRVPTGSKAIPVERASARPQAGSCHNCE